MQDLKEINDTPMFMKDRFEQWLTEMYESGKKVINPQQKPTDVLLPLDDIQQPNSTAVNTIPFFDLTQSVPTAPKPLTRSLSASLSTDHHDLLDFSNPGSRQSDTKNQSHKSSFEDDLFSFM